MIYCYAYYCFMAKAVKKTVKIAAENLHISDIEQYVIDKVKEIRVAKGISQRELAYMMDLSQGFVAKVENPKLRAKYNINHIYKLALIFKCTLADILPPLPKQ